MSSNTPDAEDAFAVLASRLRILEALCGTDAGQRYTFTELYEAADGPNTSQFAYHLDRLTPRYVQQTDGRYVVTDTGRRIGQSVAAGEYSDKPDFEPISVSTHCPDCGDTTGGAAYDDRLASVDCESCGRNLLRYDLRAAHLADRDARSALHAADRQMRAEFDTALDGICQRCGGAIEADLHTGGAVDPADAIIECICGRCGVTYSGPAELGVLSHPAVIGRCWAEDVDVRSAPLWKMLAYTAGVTVSVRDDTTALVAVADDLSLEVNLNDEIEIRRRS